MLCMAGTMFGVACGAAWGGAGKRKWCGVAADCSRWSAPLSLSTPATTLQTCEPCGIMFE